MKPQKGGDVATDALIVRGERVLVETKKLATVTRVTHLVDGTEEVGRGQENVDETGRNGHALKKWAGHVKGRESIANVLVKKAQKAGKG